MEFAIISVIIVLGLLIPLFWIIGTLGSVIYYCVDRVGSARKAQTVCLNPRLGVTMADGGHPLAAEEKPSAAINQPGVTETSQNQPERITLKPAGDKMFWWGGY